MPTTDDGGAAASGMEYEPPSLRRTEVSFDSQLDRSTYAPCTLLIELGYEATALSEVGISVGNWAGWGTLLNRKVEAKISNVGGKEGRGLYAGEQGFEKNQVITVYGGELLSYEKAKRRNDQCYIMKVKGSLFCIDGKDFAERVTHREGALFMPAPGDQRPSQGAASLANNAKGDAANALLQYRRLQGTAGSKVVTRDTASLLPAIPMLVAKRRINAGEEILFD